MYNIIVLSREDRDTGTPVTKKDCNRYEPSKFDPEDILNSEIPDEFRHISPEKMQEHETKGKTSFTYTVTVTVNVEKV